MEIAKSLSEAEFQPFVRSPKHEIQTEPRDKRENSKEAVVRKNEHKNIRPVSEQIAEFSYRPTACQKIYRMIVLRKNLSVERGENVVFDDIRYFVYVTNETELTPEQVVGEANDRCNQENLIAQLRRGVNALHVPVNDLVSNWADRDLDTAVNDYDGPARLLRNEQRSGNHWVRLTLEGTHSNRDAVGTRVEIE